jgi:hypothetical protein
LEALANQNISVTVQGKATYEQHIAALRGSPPLRFNDGREVPGEWLVEAVLEMVDHVGAELPGRCGLSSRQEQVAKNRGSYDACHSGAGS